MYTKPQNTMTLFIENQFYHVYNRANGDDQLFYTDANYFYFLEKLYSYVSAFVEIYTYCLIPNHFHLLVKVKDTPIPVRFTRLSSSEGKESNKPDRCNRIISSDGEESNKPDRCNRLITQAFSNFFNCYAKSINRQEDRSGSLFERPFKRKLIDTEEYLKMIIIYIHLNPVHYQITQSFKNYRWSSYQTLLGNQPTKLPRKTIFDIFEGRDRFIEDHRDAKINYLEIAKYALE